MMRRSHVLLAFATGMALSACRQEAAESAAPAMPAAPVAEQAAPVAAARQAPADRVLLDFRGKWWEAPEIAEAEQQRLAKLVDPASTADAQVTSRVDGAFTGAGAREQAVIVVPDGASTIDPFPRPATLAILQGDRVVARHAFGAQDPSWQWIRKAADIDGDGVQELLLTAGWMQMGESGTSLLVASLAGGKYRELQDFEQAAHNDCMARAGAPGEGKALASVYTAQAGKVVETRYEAPCPAGKDRNGNPKTPEPEDFKPVAVADKGSPP